MKYWIIFKRFSEIVIPYKEGDTRKKIAKEYFVVNPRYNLILVKRIESKEDGE